MRLPRLINLVVVALMANASLLISAAPWQDKSAGAPDPISGEWDVLFHLQGTSTPAIFKLKLEGKKVTGTAQSAHTGGGTLSKGSWVDNKLSFTLDFASHESIVVTGSLEDDRLIGEFSTEGMQGKWEAKKK